MSSEKPVSNQSHPTQQKENEIVLAILKGEIEKTLKEVVETKFQHSVSVDVFNDYVSIGLQQLLQTFSTDSQADATQKDVIKEHPAPSSEDPKQSQKKRCGIEVCIKYFGFK